MRRDLDLRLGMQYHWTKATADVGLFCWTVWLLQHHRQAAILQNLISFFAAFPWPTFQVREFVFIFLKTTFNVFLLFYSFYFRIYLENIYTEFRLFSTRLEFGKLKVASLEKVSVVTVSILSLQRGIQQGTYSQFSSQLLHIHPSSTH